MSKDLSNQNFSDLMIQLEELSSWLEEDQPDLDKAIGKFEQGMEVVTELQKRLKEAEQKIEKIALKHKSD